MVDDVLQREGRDAEVPRRVRFEYDDVLPALIPRVLPLVQVREHATDVMRDAGPTLGKPSIPGVARRLQRADVVQGPDVQVVLRVGFEHLLDALDAVQGIFDLIRPVVRVDSGRDLHVSVEGVETQAILRGEPLADVLRVPLIVLGVDAYDEDGRVEVGLERGVRGDAEVRLRARSARRELDGSRLGQRRGGREHVSAVPRGAAEAHARAHEKERGDRAEGDKNGAARGGARAVMGDEQRRAFSLGLRLRGRIVSGGCFLSGEAKSATWEGTEGDARDAGGSTCSRVATSRRTVVISGVDSVVAISRTRGRE